MGVNIGILLEFVLGGWLHEFFGWRVAFVTVGALGILLAVVVRLTLGEPPRGMATTVLNAVRQYLPPPSPDSSIYWHARARARRL